MFPVPYRGTGTGTPDAGILGNTIFEGVKMMMLELPYPPSANCYLRHFRGRVVRSAKANAYRKIVNEIAQDVDTTESPVAIEIALLPKMTLAGVASAVCLDLDNCIKVVLDALQGIAYFNDKQVRHIIAYYGEPVKDGGLRVVVNVID